MAVRIGCIVEGLGEVESVGILIRIIAAELAIGGEFESWFVAAARSLRGPHGFPPDLEAQPEPEAIRGAKEWLDARRRSGGYSPTIDQPPLTAGFDLALARSAPSFDKCVREITRLLEILRPVEF